MRPDFILIAILGACGMYLILRARLRKSADVLSDLKFSFESGSQSSTQAGPAAAAVQVPGVSLHSELGQLGLFTKHEQLRFETGQKVLPVAVAVLFLAVRACFGSTSPGVLLAFCILGLSVGYLVRKSRLRRRKQRYLHELGFHLPIVMERIVMAVQAGLDVIAAIKVLLDLEAKRMSLAGATAAKDYSLSRQSLMDPVTRLLALTYQAAEAGVSFESALRDVANSTDSSAVRHAFLHLALSFKEGGELVMPLRELSDSTQLYYQESIEEEIAKMPVKAVVPLLCTFAGLIIFFLTAPLVQILDITGRAMP